MNPFIVWVFSFLVGAFSAACDDSFQLGKDDSKKASPEADLEGEWTCIYFTQGGSELIGRKASGIYPAIWTISKGKLIPDKRIPALPSAHQIEFGAKPGTLDLFPLVDGAKKDGKHVSRCIYFLKDDFLILRSGNPRPSEFRLADNTRSPANLSVWRRGKLVDSLVDSPFAEAGRSVGSALPKQNSIEGAWTKIYYEGQGSHLSFANMSILSYGRDAITNNRPIPLAEYLPMQWKIAKQEIEESGDGDRSAVYRSSYVLNADRGTIEIIPLDKQGEKREKKRQANYFVKDDFLFICYSLAGPRVRASEIFSTSVRSETGLLILLRGTLK